MPKTPRGFSFPAPTARPNVPADLEALALDVDSMTRRTVSGSLALALSGTNTAALTVPVPPAVQAWPSGYIVTAIARQTSGNYVAAITQRDATEWRVRVSHLTGANATLTVNVDYTITEV